MDNKSPFPVKILEDNIPADEIEAKLLATKDAMERLKDNKDFKEYMAIIKRTFIDPTFEQLMQPFDNVEQQRQIAYIHKIWRIVLGFTDEIIKYSEPVKHIPNEKEGGILDPDQ